MNREQRAALAQQTMEILESGYYVAPSGRRVEIGCPFRRRLSVS